VPVGIGGAGRPVPLWARITRRSTHELALKVGNPVYALVKSVALERRSFSLYDPSAPRDDD